MTDRIMDTYSIIHRGRKYLSLFKHGNKRSTMVYRDGLEMTADIGWYLANRDCRIVLHDKNAEVVRVITSSGA